MQITSNRNYPTHQDFPEILKQRFWERVDKDGPVPEHIPNLGQCWLWITNGIKPRYGKIAFGGICFSAHKLSYILNIGDVPDGMLVCHKCDVGICVRPYHLWIGTSAENNHDRHKKGRTASGDNSGARLHPETHVRGVLQPTSKLDEYKVRRIRELYETTNRSQQSIADEIGVSQITVSRAILRQTWAHIP